MHNRHFPLTLHRHTAKERAAFWAILTLLIVIVGVGWLFAMRQVIGSAAADWQQNTPVTTSVTAHLKDSLEPAREQLLSTRVEWENILQPVADSVVERQAALNIVSSIAKDQYVEAHP